MSFEETTKVMQICRRNLTVDDRFVMANCFRRVWLPCGFPLAPQGHLSPFPSPLAACCLPATWGISQPDPPARIWHCICARARSLSCGHSRVSLALALSSAAQCRAVYFCGYAYNTASQVGICRLCCLHWLAGALTYTFKYRGTFARPEDNTPTTDARIGSVTKLTTMNSAYLALPYEGSTLTCRLRFSWNF